MKVVILGTAHLESTPGKRSPDGKFREYKYSREIIEDIKTKLESYGYLVLVDVPQDDLKGYDQNIELSYRVQKVNNWCKTYGVKNCVYVSVHVNAAGSDGKWHTATGWEAYTTKGVTKADKLAESGQADGDRIYDIIKSDRQLPNDCRELLLKYIDEIV